MPMTAMPSGDRRRSLIVRSPGRRTPRHGGALEFGAGLRFVSRGASRRRPVCRDARRDARMVGNWKRSVMGISRFSSACTWRCSVVSMRESAPRSKKLSCAPTASWRNAFCQRSGEQFFQVALRRDIFGGETRAFRAGRGESVAVELAVDGERQDVEENEGGGNHVLGKFLAKIGTQVLDASFRGGADDEVGDEAGLGAVIGAGEDGAVLDAVVAREHRTRFR